MAAGQRLRPDHTGRTSRAGTGRESQPPAGAVESRGERIGAFVDDLRTQGPPAGFYPSFGSVYTSGLFAIGPGYHIGVGDTGIFDIYGIWSLRGYKKLSTKFVMPRLANDRLTLTTRANWFDATHVPFYGIGAELAGGRQHDVPLCPIAGLGGWGRARLAPGVAHGRAWPGRA